MQASTIITTTNEEYKHGRKKRKEEAEEYERCDKIRKKK